MTNTFKKFALAAIAAATMVAGVTSANASGMNALASFKADTALTKVGFFKKGGKFTNRGVATIGLGAAVVGGLLAKKAINHRNDNRARRHYVKPRRHYTKPRRHYAEPRRYYKKPRYVAKKYHAPRVYRPAIAFNQTVFNQQTWLNQVGYNAGVADGKMGRNTRTAASQFQLANGMPATGYLTAPQTSLLAQHASLALAQRNNPYPVQTVAAPTLKYAQPVAPTAYAPQVRYAPTVQHAPTTQVQYAPAPTVQHAPTTQVQYAPAPTVQHVPTTQVQYAPAPKVQHVPAAPAPHVQYYAPAATPAPVKPIAHAPAAQNYVPAVQY